MGSVNENSAMKFLFVTSFTETSTIDLEGAGTVRKGPTGKIYRWVKNASDDAARVGAPACFDAGNLASAAFLQECTTEDMVAADDVYFAGVWLAAVAGGSYGWIQQWGVYSSGRILYCTGKTTPAVGDLCFPNMSTDTADTTLAGAPYAFHNLIAQGVTEGSVNTALFTERYVNPHAVLLEVGSTSAAASTVPDTLTMFIKGLL